MKILDKTNREDINSMLDNSGQSEMSNTMKEFANSIPDINTIEDLKYLDEAYFEYFKRNPNTKKFDAPAAHIFERRTFSGCSDIGLTIAPILREKGIPTVYVESAHIEWLQNVQEGRDNNQMRGHIFLEVFIDNQWYLYDPTFSKVYDNYNCSNNSLPRGYYAFAKGSNSFDFGVHSVEDERNLGLNVLGGMNILEYQDPEYSEIDLKNISNEKRL